MPEMRSAKDVNEEEWMDGWMDMEYFISFFFTFFHDFKWFTWLVQDYYDYSDS